MTTEPRGNRRTLFRLLALTTLLLITGLALRSYVRDQRSPASPRNDATLPVLPGQALGPLRLNMTQDELQKIMGRPDMTLANTWSYNDPDLAVTWSKSTPPTATALFAGGTPRTAVPVRTPDGVGLGSTSSAILASLGPPDRQNATSIIYLAKGIHFMLADDRVTWFCVRPPTTRPATTQATEIESGLISLK